MLHKKDRNVANPAAIANEMQTIVRRAAEPWAPGDSTKAAIGRAARATGFGFRRVKALWYGERATVSAVEADALRRWHRQWLATRKARLLAEIEQLERNWSDE